VGTARRECLNYFLILNARHLRRTLTLYFRVITTPELTSDWLSGARLRAGGVKRWNYKRAVRWHPGEAHRAR
jgi:hypothetical protein